MMSIQKVYQWTPSAGNETSSSFLEVSSGLFGFKFRRRWRELEQSVASSRSQNCRSRLGVAETSNMNSYNVTSPTPSVTSSVAVDGIRVSRLCNLATGCTGKRRVTALEKRCRKSRNHKLDHEDISRARAKSLPLPKRQNSIPTKSGFASFDAKLARQKTPPAHRSRQIVSNDALRNFRDAKSSSHLRKECRDDDKYRHRPLIIHRRAVSMESIQQVFDFYDEDTSNDDDQYQHQVEGPTFEVIDIVEPSKALPENREYCNGVDMLTQERQDFSMRNISPSLPLENGVDSHGYECGTENTSRHKLRSPELVRLAAMRGGQRSSIPGQARGEDCKQCSVSAGDQPGMLTRHRSESVLTRAGTVLSHSESCGSLLGPGKFSDPPSDVLGLSQLPQVHDEGLKLVSSFSKRKCVHIPTCVRARLSYLLNDAAYSVEYVVRIQIFLFTYVI
jgi:hypothetical protein